MTDVPLPLLSAPGRFPNAAGGRLINTMIEPLSATSGKKYGYFRVPGLKPFGTSNQTGFRGAIEVNGTFYAVIGTKVCVYPSGGGAPTYLPGAVNGTALVTIARDNAATPHVVIVSPGDGAFLISGGAVVVYPDVNVGQPNSVVYHKGVFNFTYGNGIVRNSNIDSTTISTTSFATAESKPDALYRSIPLPNGQILLAGSASMEIWGGQNDTGYIFSYVLTIQRGIIGPYAIAGHEDGFGKGIFFVGDDLAVSTLNGSTTVKISPTELDILIEREPVKSNITVSVFIVEGHSYVAVQGATWCWVYDVGVQTWHERQSYLVTYWRAVRPVKAFNKWLCGDAKSGSVLEITGLAQDEVGDPLRMRIETGPFGAFPDPIRVNEIELYLTRGVGDALGADPVQTDPQIEVSMSPDGGTTWRGPRVLSIGKQAERKGRVRAGIWGHSDNQGARWRFDMSANVGFGLMGADMKVDVLK